jgi:hypothetical protein
MDFGSNEEFARMSETIMGLVPKKRCDLTLDELLDKINDQGINSLTEEEKNKLDEYSKTIN